MATVAQINGRQSTIVAITNDTGRCSVADLAERFCVTAETIRRDLKSLEAKGLLRRVHGGAVAGALTPQSDLVATDDDDELPIQQSQRRKNLIAQTRPFSLMPAPPPRPSPVPWRIIIGDKTGALLPTLPMLPTPLPPSVFLKSLFWAAPLRPAPKPSSGQMLWKPYAVSVQISLSWGPPLSVLPTGSLPPTRGRRP